MATETSGQSSARNFEEELRGIGWQQVVEMAHNAGPRIDEEYQNRLGTERRLASAKIRPRLLADELAPDVQLMRLSRLTFNPLKPRSYLRSSIIGSKSLRETPLALAWTLHERTSRRLSYDQDMAIVETRAGNKIWSKPDRLSTELIVVTSQGELVRLESESYDDGDPAFGVADRPLKVPALTLREGHERKDTNYIQSCLRWDSKKKYAQGDTMYPAGVITAERIASRRVNFALGGQVTAEITPHLIAGKLLHFLIDRGVITDPTPLLEATADH